MDFEIVHVSKKELQEIENLAKEIWPIAYQEILSQAQINYMLPMMYSLESLQTQFEKGNIFYAIYKNENMIAFASCEIFKEINAIKVHKIYVHPQWQGHQLGVKLIDKIIALGTENKCSRIFLNVNKYNKAIGFYKKIGMHIAKEEIINIGNNYIMDDYVMEKNI
jgi:diamine N-acetyltransferase